MEGVERLRAVIFDLWNTLADWPAPETHTLLEAVGIGAEQWDETRDVRWTAPLDQYLAGLGLAPDRVGEVVEVWHGLTRPRLVPVAGAIDALDELRARGLRLGLISNCSGDVPELWPETAFAGRFDCEVFSARAGLSKPDPRIYRLALERLGVEPHDAIFVGDGDNGELPGAERVGIRAICLRSRPDWRGETIQSLSDLLALLPIGGHR